MNAITSADLYRWRERVEAAVCLVLGESDQDTLDEREELQAVADEILEAYLDAVSRETVAA